MDNRVTATVIDGWRLLPPGARLQGAHSHLRHDARPHLAALPAYVGGRIRGSPWPTITPLHLENRFGRPASRAGPVARTSGKSPRSRKDRRSAPPQPAASGL